VSGEEGVRDYRFLLPSPGRRGAGGEVKIVLVEFTLSYAINIDYIQARE
jgi:hypothetical protein